MADDLTLFKSEEKNNTNPAQRINITVLTSSF